MDIGIFPGLNIGIILGTMNVGTTPRSTLQSDVGTWTTQSLWIMRKNANLYFFARCDRFRDIHLIWCTQSLNIYPVEQRWGLPTAHAPT